MSEVMNVGVMNVGQSKIGLNVLHSTTRCSILTPGRSSNPIPSIHSSTYNAMVVHPSKTVLFDWVGFENNYDVILFTAISFVVSFMMRPLLAWMPRDVRPVHSRALLCAPRLSPLGLHEPFHEPFAT